MSKYGLLFYVLYIHKYSNSLYRNCSFCKYRNCNIYSKHNKMSPKIDTLKKKNNQHRFHTRPCLDVYTATIKLHAVEEKKKQTTSTTSNILFLFITLHWNIQTFQNFLTTPLSYSLFLGIFHLQSTSSAKVGKQFINLKPFSATVPAFTWNNPLTKFLPQHLLKNTQTKWKKENKQPWHTTASFRWVKSPWPHLWCCISLFGLPFYVNYCLNPIIISYYYSSLVLISQKKQQQQHSAETLRHLKHLKNPYSLWGIASEEYRAKEFWIKFLLHVIIFHLFSPPRSTLT